MRALLALIVLLSAGTLTPSGAFAATQAVAPAETPALMAARRLYAKARAGPQGEGAAAAINARWNFATQLVENSRFAEGEIEFRAIEAILLPRPDTDDRNLIAIQARIANAQLGQEHWAEAAETALPAYQRALALYGPDHATTHDLRMSMGASLARLERYAESEPYVRAGFDYLRRTGGDQDAADIAATLALIYNRLNRPDEARAVVRLVEGADPIGRLINVAARADNPADEAAAWRGVLDALPAGDERRSEMEVKLAFALAMSASSSNPEPAREAAARMRVLLAYAQANALPELAREAHAVLGMALGSLEEEDAAAGEEAMTIALDRLETARRELGEDHRDTVSRRLYYAMVAASQQQAAIGLPELDRVEAWVGAHPGAFDNQNLVFISMTRALLLGAQGDTRGAYRAMARTTGAMQGVALEQIDQSRKAYLDRWGGLFQAQVKWAWRYAATLAGTPLEAPASVPAGTAGPVAD
ncbi:hypothetical protein [Brevundimonas sp.]|uniref:hypothetical protein n=1 Tax=Brevundimonas sp. TaxID=1871086 RepID=UPI001A1CEFC0|nr:hypothetical protein [Brevundimonas sp.]MBJ7485131.1 hypothetical protein [Brevundimonas sp.]